MQLQCKKMQVSVSEIEDEVRFIPRENVDPNDKRTQFEKIADQTSALWRKPYHEQLEEKLSNTSQVFSDFCRRMYILEPLILMN
jgi:N-formylglutamate amidohydrolase